MTLSKWTIDFRPDQKSSLAPVWINLPGLPLPFFDPKYLNKLGSLYGRLLKIDDATLSLKRPSVARILVEIDVKAEQKSSVWIGDEDWDYGKRLSLKTFLLSVIIAHALASRVFLPQKVPREEFETTKQRKH